MMYKNESRSQSSLGLKSSASSIHSSLRSPVATPTRMNFDSAFPVFVPGVQYKSVYERAGFEVNRSGSGSGSGRTASSASSVRSGHRLHAGPSEISILGLSELEKKLGGISPLSANFPANDSSATANTPVAPPMSLRRKQSMAKIKAMTDIPNHDPVPDIDSDMYQNEYPPSPNSDTPKLSVPNNRPVSTSSSIYSESNDPVTRKSVMPPSHEKSNATGELYPQICDSLENMSLSHSNDNHNSPQDVFSFAEPEQVYDQGESYGAEDRNEQSYIAYPPGAEDRDELSHIAYSQGAEEQIYSETMSYEIRHEEHSYTNYESSYGEDQVYTGSGRYGEFLDDSRSLSHNQIHPSHDEGETTNGSFSLAEEQPVSNKSDSRDSPEILGTSYQSDNKFESDSFAEEKYSNDKSVSPTHHGESSLLEPTYNYTNETENSGPSPRSSKDSTDSRLSNMTINTTATTPMESCSSSTSASLIPPQPEMESFSFEDAGPTTAPSTTQPTKKGKKLKTPCRGCNKPIMGKAVSAKHSLSGRWHRECFKCHGCECDFPGQTGMEFYILHDWPYCRQCYHIANNSICSGCGEGIEGECLETVENNGLLLRYHKACLVCSTCGDELDHDEYYSVDGLPQCNRHVGINHKAERRRTRLMFM